MKRGLLSILLAILAIIVFPSGIIAQVINNYGLIPQTVMSKPAVGEMIKEPNFNTNLVRITDTTTTDKLGQFPNSANQQAWNVDESLLLLKTGNGNVLLYDGQTYKLKKTLEGVTGEDVFWHPTNPFLVIYNSVNNLFSYNVITDEVNLIHSFSDFASISSKGGNLSDNGRYYAFLAKFPILEVSKVTNPAPIVKYEKLVLFDIWRDQIISESVVAKQFVYVNSVSMSPNGNYIVVNYLSTRDSGNMMDIYDQGFNLIWRQFVGVGNSELSIDANGDEVILLDRYDAKTNSRFVEKYRLFDGYMTTLLEHSPAFYANLSTRNLTRFGWCLVSTYDNETRLTDSVETWLPFEDEVFLLKMDGSQQVERLAHHRSRRYSPSTPTFVNSVPFAEPQATFSRNADRILFASNWRENISSVSNIDAYVIDLRGVTNPIKDFSIVLTPEAINVKKGQTAEIDIDIKALGDFSEQVNLDFAISPNPENFRAFFTTSMDGSGKTKIMIMPISNIAEGKYLLHIMGTTINKMHHAGALIAINNAKQGFDLRVQPISMTVRRGETAKVMIGIERMGDFNGEVNVWVTDTKSLRIKANPVSISTSSSMVDFNLKTKAKTPIGTHKITFAGMTEAGQFHTAEMFLTVVE